jgi:drug/metabolite transporter (DMT)-like permease
MLWGAAVLAPLALVIDHPWTLSPSSAAIGATMALSIFSTGAALMLYFRLVRTLGSLGVASQAYMRAGFGVLLGMVFLGETLSLLVAAGLAAAILGVALINWPRARD